MKGIFTKALLMTLITSAAMSFGMDHFTPGMENYYNELFNRTFQTMVEEKAAQEVVTQAIQEVTAQAAQVAAVQVPEVVEQVVAQAAPAVQAATEVVSEVAKQSKIKEIASNYASYALEQGAKGLAYAKDGLVKGYNYVANGASSKASSLYNAAAPYATQAKDGVVNAASYVGTKSVNGFNYVKGGAVNQATRFGNFTSPYMTKAKDGIANAASYVGTKSANGFNYVKDGAVNQATRFAAYAGPKLTQAGEQIKAGFNTAKDFAMTHGTRAVQAVKPYTYDVVKAHPYASAAVGAGVVTLATAYTFRKPIMNRINAFRNRNATPVVHAAAPALQPVQAELPVVAPAVNNELVEQLKAAFAADLEVLRSDKQAEEANSKFFFVKLNSSAKEQLAELQAIVGKFCIGKHIQFLSPNIFRNNAMLALSNKQDAETFAILVEELVAEVTEALSKIQ